MGFETKPSSRANQTTAKSVIAVGSGNSKTKRISLTSAVSSVTLPERVTSVVFHNAGTEDIFIRINSSGSDFFTIKPGVILPKIIVNRSTIDARSTAIGSVLECILEG